MLRCHQFLSELNGIFTAIHQVSKWTCTMPLADLVQLKLSFFFYLGFVYQLVFHVKTVHLKGVFNNVFLTRKIGQTKTLTCF